MKNGEPWAPRLFDVDLIWHGKRRAGFRQVGDVPSLRCPGLLPVGAYARFILGGRARPLAAPAAVGEGFALIDLAVLRLQHPGSGGVGLEAVREGELVIAPACRILEHEVQGLLHRVTTGLGFALDH